MVSRPRISGTYSGRARKNNKRIDTRDYQDSVLTAAGLCALRRLSKNRVFACSIEH